MKPPTRSRAQPTSIRIVEQEKIELTNLAQQEGISLAQYLLQGARLKKHVDALAKEQARELSEQIKEEERQASKWNEFVGQAKEGS